MQELAPSEKPTNWSQFEIDAAVRQYLRILEVERTGEEINKAEVNRLLRTAELSDRTRGAIEYRMCNISAVMEKLGRNGVSGYKPRRNVGIRVEAMIESAIVGRLRIQAEVAGVRKVMQSIFSSQCRLRDLAPEHSWRGLGNLLGDYGEFVCVRYYQLTKAEQGSAGFDAWNSSGRTVQIKANRSSGTIGFRGEAELLLAVHIDESASWNEMYYGDFEAVARIARFSRRDNKFTVTRDRLKALAIDMAS